MAKADKKWEKKLHGNRAKVEPMHEIDSLYATNAVTNNRKQPDGTVETGDADVALARETSEKLKL